MTPLVSIYKKLRIKIYGQTSVLRNYRFSSIMQAANQKHQAAHNSVRMRNKIEEADAKLALSYIKAKIWSKAQEIIMQIISRGVFQSSLFHCKSSIIIGRLPNSSASIEIAPTTLWEIGNFLKRNPQLLLMLPVARSRISRERRVQIYGQSGCVTGRANDLVVPNTVDYSIKILEGASDDGSRPAMLVRPLLSIDWVRANVSKLDVLTIGPRSEAEIFMLWGEGFSPEKIKGIDLFSYSPLIDVGDAHHLPYADNSFDIIVVGWVLAYSKNPSIIGREIIRVARPGAYITVGCAYTPPELRLNHAKNLDRIKLQVGSDIDPTLFSDTSEILDCFGDAVDKVIFKSDVERERKSEIASLVCIFKKA